MKKTPSLFGGACIIASVCVGAGMLGIPTSGAGAWTVWTLFILLLTMIMMGLSGSFLLEAYQKYDHRVSFSSVTLDLLGAKVNAINNLAVYFVGGILLYAYTTVSGNILTGLLGTISFLGDSSTKLYATIFVLVFSSLVWHSTKAVDRISVLLIILMFLTFIFSISGLAINIEIDKLLDLNNQSGEYSKYAIALLPVALTSFGYHHSVTTMRAYYKDERKAFFAILGGISIALILYVLWVMSVFGNLGRNDFAPVIAQGGDVNVLIDALGTVVDSQSVKNTINAFSIAAILSSFIGVGLGVFDYLADFFKFDNSKQGRLKSWAVTFLPPLILSVLYPLGFLKAIGYAGAVATIWTCIIPAILVKKVRESENYAPNFKTKGGDLPIYALLAFGIITAVVHLLSMFELLPVFK